MNKKELENEVEAYLKYYYIVKQEFDIYKYIKQNAELYSRETKQIAYFLNPVLYSLLNSTLLAIYKLLDNREEKNIYKVFNIFIQNLNEIVTNKNSKKEKNEILTIMLTATSCGNNAKKEEIDSKQELLNNIKEYRDKIIAHSDKKYFAQPDQVFKDFNMKYEDLEKMLIIIEKILNELLYIVCDTKFVFLEEYKDDYKYLLECIKEHNIKLQKGKG